MSFNLIDLIKDQLSERIINQVGDALGVDPDKLNSAIGGAIPGLLSGLTNLCSDTTKGTALVNAINNQDDSILNNLDDLLGSSDKRESLLSAGTHLLSSLFGNSSFGHLADAVGEYGGIDSNSSKSLLGILAPMVFGIIKRKLLGNGGLDLQRLMDMFSAQKDNIAAAMPSGLGQRLEEIGFASHFSDNLNDVEDDVSDSIKHTPSAGSAWLARLIPLAILLGVIWFAYNQFLKSEIKIPEPASDNVVNPAVAPSTNVAKQKVDILQSQTNLSASGVKDNLKVILGSVSDSLGSITNVETARQKIPEIKVAISKLDGLANTASKLPEPAKQPLQQLVSARISNIQVMIDKVSAIPGVGPVIRPVADGLLEKLQLFL